MEINAFVQQLGRWSSGKGALQRKLAGAITQAVRNGTIAPGTRLPSERNLAAALNLSRTTVLAAYDALREIGWAESRTGSGTWISERSRDVATARAAAHAAENVSGSLLHLLNHRDAEMVDFALGCPMPLRELPIDRFMVPPQEYATLVNDRLYYPLGLPALRHGIAALYAEAGLPTEPDHILVSNGAQHSIALCALLFLQRGDTVLIEDPTYFGALDAFRAVGARIGSLPVESDGVRPAILRDRITVTAPRLVYLTPTYQNPTGALMPVEARREIARMAAEFAVPVIDDRTLADFTLEGAATPPLAAFAQPSAPVISIGSLGKLLWPGLRVGWIRAPEPIVERLARVKTAMDLGSPLITQAISARLLENIGEARRLRRRELKPRRDLLAALLNELLPDWSFRVPTGGLFFWVRLPRGDSRRFAQVALRHGVAVVPGPIMSAAGQHARFLRLPFLAEPETLRIAVRRLSAAWREYDSSDRKDGVQGVSMV
jgi:DNA-binding transcriptional MocR family regulator